MVWEVQAQTRRWHTRLGYTLQYEKRGADFRVAKRWPAVVNV